MPDEAELAMLDLILGEDWKLHLFQNDVIGGLTPAQIEALDETDFTEANFPGYANVTLVVASWVTAEGDPASGSYATQTFTRSSSGSAQTIYGYYYTKSVGGKLRGFRQLDAPMSITSEGDEIEITPVIHFSDGAGDTVPIGSSVDFRGSTAPDGYLLEDGSNISRTTYADLFAVIGTTYGVGDGSTTFTLPDTRGKFSLGLAASGVGSVLGETGGTLDHTHDLNGVGAGAEIFLDEASDAVIGGLTTLTSWPAGRAYNATGDVVSVDTGIKTDGTSLQGYTLGANPAYLAVTRIIRAT